MTWFSGPGSQILGYNINILQFSYLFIFTFLDIVELLSFKKINNKGLFPWEFTVIYAY